MANTLFDPGPEHIPPKPVMYLGQLDINEYFRPQGSRVVYQTTTYPKSRVNHSAGTRWCQNVKTFKSKWFFCRTRVVRVSREKY